MVISTFYALHWLIPEKLPMHYELVSLILIAISVFILFPAREMLLAYLLKDDHSLLFHKGLGDLGSIKRYPSIGSLIHNDFPNFIGRLGLSVSSLAILEIGRKAYRIYHYRKKKLITNEILKRKEYDKLCRMLAKNPRGVSIENKFLSKETQAQMKKLNARLIYPLLYHKSVLGFFIFRGIPLPRGDWAKEFIEIFRRKATLSAQNHILSQRVIDNRIYDQEFAIASRIQRGLKNTQGPKIENYKIELLDADTPLMFEFFMLAKRRWLFALMICRPFTGSTGILVYSLIGQLYSLIHLPKRMDLQKLFHSIKSSADKQSAGASIKILFLDLDEKSRKMNFLTEERDFRIEKHQNGPGMKVKRKNIVRKYESTSLEVEASLELSYQEVPILKISNKSEGKTKSKARIINLGK